jgi:hypothetical protein
MAECNKHPEAADFCTGLAGIYCFAATYAGTISRQCGCKPGSGPPGAGARV